MRILSNKDVERAIGDEFVRWYAGAKGVEYTFLKQSGDGEVPDLFYEPNLVLEITRAFNAEGDAKDLGDLQRGKQRQTSQKVFEPDAQLIRSIADRLEDKCSRAYGSNCILVIYADVPLCDEENMGRLVPEIPIPKHQPFAEVFLLCRIPPGLFHAWQLA